MVHVGLMQKKFDSDHVFDDFSDIKQEKCDSDHVFTRFLVTIAIFLHFHEYQAALVVTIALFTLQTPARSFSAGGTRPGRISARLW